MAILQGFEKFAQSLRDAWFNKSVQVGPPGEMGPAITVMHSYPEDVGFATEVAAAFMAVGASPTARALANNGNIRFLSMSATTDRKVQSGAFSVGGYAKIVISVRELERSYAVAKQSRLA